MPIKPIKTEKDYETALEREGEHTVGRILQASIDSARKKIGV